jgi:ADP-ribosyl-[dinitrogen reductase] hydrolase
MLIEIAVGDAYGVGFEYASENAHLNDLSKYIKHPTMDVDPGKYTDDTQMSLAVAELVMEQETWTPEIVVNKFIHAFKRDPRQGYSRALQAVLERFSTYRGFIGEVKGDSDRSGGAMRAGPCGIYKDIQEVKARAAIQASVTHNSKDGLAAAHAAALMTHYFIYDLGPKADLGKFLDEHSYCPSGSWDEPYLEKVNQKGWNHVRAAVTGIKEHSGLAACLKWMVSLGGDTDTSAAIAMAGGSCSKEMIKDLPQHLFNELESGSYGRSYIFMIDHLLLSMKGKL